MKCKDCSNFSCSYRNSFEKCFYQDDYLDEDFNWQSFRTEAAKDILCTTLSGGIASGMIDMIAIIQEKESIVNGSIEIADELIRQLKEKEER